LFPVRILVALCADEGRVAVECHRPPERVTAVTVGGHEFGLLGPPAPLSNEHVRRSRGSTVRVLFERRTNKCGLPIERDRRPEPRPRVGVGSDELGPSSPGRIAPLEDVHRPGRIAFVVVPPIGPDQRGGLVERDRRPEVLETATVTGPELRSLMERCLGRIHRRGRFGR
jgi:hypothetical protein